MFDINFVNWAFEPFVKMMEDINLSSLKSDETIDLFYGDWKQIPLYMDDIMNVQHLTENEYSALSLRFELMRHMRALGFNSASYNYIGAGTSIPPHIDSDLTSGIVAFRVFIPMIPTKFKFSGKEDWANMTIGEIKTYDIPKPTFFGRNEFVFVLLKSN